MYIGEWFTIDNYCTSPNRWALSGCQSQSAADSGARESDGSAGIDPHGYGFWVGLLFWQQNLLSTWSAYQYPTAWNSQLSTSPGQFFLQKCMIVIISARGHCSIQYCLTNTYLRHNLQMRSILSIRPILSLLLLPFLLPQPTCIHHLQTTHSL